MEKGLHTNEMQFYEDQTCWLYKKWVVIVGEIDKYLLLVKKMMKRQAKIIIGTKDVKGTTDKLIQMKKEISQKNKENKSQENTKHQRRRRSKDNEESDLFRVIYLDCENFKSIFEFFRDIIRKKNSKNQISLLMFFSQNQAKANQKINQNEKCKTPSSLIFESNFQVNHFGYFLIMMLLISDLVPICPSHRYSVPNNNILNNSNQFYHSRILYVGKLPKIDPTEKPEKYNFEEILGKCSHSESGSLDSKKQYFLSQKSFFYCMKFIQRNLNKIKIKIYFLDKNNKGRKERESHSCITRLASDSILKSNTKTNQNNEPGIFHYYINAFIDWFQNRKSDKNTEKQTELEKKKEEEKLKRNGKIFKNLLKMCLSNKIEKEFGDLNYECSDVLLWSLLNGYPINMECNKLDLEESWRMSTAIIKQISLKEDSH